MKYVLVNRFDEIVDSVDLDSDVGNTGATRYFQGVKQMADLKTFSKFWKVMSNEEYETIFKATLQNRQLGRMKYKWWKEEDAGLDPEKR